MGSAKVSTQDYSKKHGTPQGRRTWSFLNMDTGNTEEFTGDYSDAVARMGSSNYRLLP